MAEAVITRGGIGGGSTDISNDTKQSLGLNNNASLDDVIQVIAIKDPSVATILVTVQDADGSPLAGQNVQMVTNTSLIYTSNELGQCKFKTNYGSATIKDLGPNPYIDMQLAEDKTVDAIIGDIYKVTLKRRTFGNGYNKAITSNQNIMFSKYINTIDIKLSGAGGGGGTGFLSDFKFLYNYYGIETKKANGHNGGAGGNGYINYKNGFTPEANKNYSINIGVGSAPWSNKYMNEDCGDDSSDRKNRTHSWSRDGVNLGWLHNGSTGGTTFFSDILSAIGGHGGTFGSYSSDGTKGSGYTGQAISIGGDGGYYGITGSIWGAGGDEYNGWKIRGYCNAYATGGSAGTSGVCYLNNFKYKI